MVGSGPQNTVVLTRDTLVETVHGDRDEYDGLCYGSFDSVYGLYRVFFHLDWYILGTVNDMV